MNDAALIQDSHRVLNHHARTFSLASRLLPPGIRDNVAVTYAVCRLIDDTVDDAPGAKEAEAGLQAIKDEWEERAKARPLLRVFKNICHEHQIPDGAVRELIVGVGGDLGTIRFTTDRDLLRYSYRVAGTVGIIMARLIGVTDSRALPHAVDLGVGMQITNICRDVLEDAQRDRIYVPEERLKAQGITCDSLIAGSAPRPALGRVISDMLVMADQYYESGRAGMAYIPTVPRTAIATAAQMYRGIGIKIEQQRYNVLAGRTVVGAKGKLKLFAQGLGFSMLCPIQPQHPHRTHLHRHFDGFDGVNLPTFQ